MKTTKMEGMMRAVCCSLMVFWMLLDSILAQAQAPVSFLPQPGPATLVIPLFQKPFTDDFRLTNFFDHDLPFEFVDTNGLQLTWWGERTRGIEGHNGYDWVMPEGTPLLAVADGDVVFAGAGTPSFCPPLNQTVSGLTVSIQHLAPNGERFTSIYGHASRIDVQQGQRVQAGQQIALSGTTGCSTGPHLHFGVRRLTNTNNGQPALIDPFGWAGNQPDPWAQHPQGAQSVWLWQDGQVPAIFREGHGLPNPNPGSNAPVAITTFRWMGWRDDQHPNNEFVELTLDPRFAPAGMFDLTGSTLRNTRGAVFNFPGGFTILADQPVRIYTGPGINTATELYWGQNQGVWDNLDDCARLMYARGGMFTFSLFGNCGAPEPTSLVAAVLPSSRSVRVGTPATVFATMINTGLRTAFNCQLTSPTDLPASFAFQSTDPGTNQVTGTANTALDIASGAAQSFVVALTPTGPIPPTDIALSFTCANSALAPSISGLNTLLLSASTIPIPDLVALAATTNNDGIVNIPGSTGTGVFAVATVNLGTSATITAMADTGSVTLPLHLTLCETEPREGVCLAPPASSVTTQINASATPTFGIFVMGSDDVPFDPASNRVFVRFRDTTGVVRGATSVAVRMQ